MKKIGHPTSVGRKVAGGQTGGGGEEAQATQSTTARTKNSCLLFWTDDRTSDTGHQNHAPVSPQGRGGRVASGSNSGQQPVSYFTLGHGQAYWHTGTPPVRPRLNTVLWMAGRLAAVKTYREWIGKE